MSEKTKSAMVAQILEGARKLGPQYPEGWNVTPFDEVNPKLGSDYLIKGLIFRDSMHLIYGASSAGKTFFTCDIAARIATEIPWRGKFMSQGLVMYLSLENPNGVLKRIKAWRDHFAAGSRNVPFIVVSAPLNLGQDHDVHNVIEGYRLAMKQFNVKPGAIVIDTLSRANPGLDENSPEMTVFIGKCDRIRHELGVAVIIIHHSGKNRSLGPRGHSSLHSAVDVEIEVHDKVATAKKVRDGVSGTEYPFSLQRVELGFDPDGEMDTTCIVIDQQEQMARPKKLDKPTGANQKVVFDVIRDLIQERGEVLPETSTIPKGSRGVKIEDVVTRAAPKIASDEKRKRERILTAIRGLQDQELIGISDPYCWIWR